MSAQPAETDNVDANKTVPPPSQPALEFHVRRPVYNYADFNNAYGEALLGHAPFSSTVRSSMAKACSCSRDAWRLRALNLLPLVGQIRTGQYSKMDIVSDLVAGFTTCVFHIPQGLAYGLLAGLKPINGLYTSLIPVFIYALFGRSRHLSIGTFSLMSLLLSDMIIGNYEAYLPRLNATALELPLNYTAVEYAKLQSAIVGSFAASLIILAIGVFRLGFFMRYVSDSMLKGFTAAAAVQVLVSQLPLLLGVKPERTVSQFKIAGSLINLFQVIETANFVTMGLSAACCAVLYLVKEFINPLVKKKFKVPLPIELLIIIITLLASEFSNMSSNLGVVIVGEVPRGLPVPIIPDLGFLPTVFPSAIPVGIVGGVVTMSLAKMYCLEFQYSYDFNEDFAILGVSSLVSSFFQCFFACGALARNSVVVSVGMKSQISSLISCSGMLLVLLAIGPYFRSIPTCVLGSIIVVSLINVIKQVTELPQIWRISRIDFSVWLVAALSVLILDVTLGLAIGLGFTLFSVVLRTQSPRIAVLGRIGDTDIYRNVRVYAAAEELPGLKIVRFDAPLNFANAERFQDFVLQLAHEARRPAEAEPVGRVEAEHPESDEATAVHTFVLDCSSWVSVDMVGVRTVKETYQRLKKQGYRVLFARCKESVRLHLHLHDFYKHADRSLFFISLHDAVLYASNVPPISQDEISSSSEHVNEAIEIEGEEGMPATNLVTMDTNL
ncbi:hypothetical protein BOX15_Mlig014609g2 [Macrostomum lignano]|uniref:STAS domain-containing protein n=2 Tax=Macrostomum lignano TaxID=282301 RepID=A0A267GPK9_9PLAT|nr:hypothetical protein BOX15_Mlig014609g2 [Macrostomum lignano]